MEPKETRRNQKKEIKIMIVEDSPTQAEELKHILERNNLAVVSASNGREALDLLQKHTPDIVVSDIIMPEMDGYQLCRRIKSDKNLRHIPVILLTSLSDPRDIVKGLQSRADNFITKPYDEKHLVSSVQALLANRELQKTEKVSPNIEILFAGEKYTVSSSRIQILNLLRSTYEMAVQKNLELIRTKETINEQLEQKVKERTAALEAEVTERKRAQERIRKLLDFRTVIQQVNETLLRIKTEEELYQKVCDLLANLEGIKFVWIGLTQKENSEIRPVAKAGQEEGYLSAAEVTHSEPRYNHCPAGTAVRTKQPCAVDDLETDSRFPLIKQEATKRGFISAVSVPLMEHEGTVVGVLSLFSERKQAFGHEEVGVLKEVAGDIAVGIKSMRLEKQVGQSMEKLKRALNGTIGAISLMSEVRDPYTSGHERKVAQLSRAIAEEMGFSPDQMEGIYVTGFLHDIGKIAVPAEILTKPGSLKEHEFNIIKLHSETGYNILKQLEFPWPLAETVLQHHERLNGSGYPAGLKGEEVSREARIIGVSDVVEAMSSHRPYRPALGIGKALEEIVKNKGILYDPAVVDACLAVFKKGFKFQ